ncbi:MAG: DeoR/GlpR transcriptional regulator [Spirochaetales bacterium]|nr:DeoR/GlpR transcriptional regulator [Spirochaetales bacterium]
MKMQRIQEMKKLFISKQSITNKELCDTFGISIETVRRDLSYLESEGFIRKVYGGAALAEVSQAAIAVDEWDIRMKTNSMSKLRIAEKAVELIPDGSTIFLDSGTSVYEVSTFLASRTNITVLTNSIRIAEVLGMNPKIMVYFIGGVIKADTLASVGIFASEFLSNFYHIDYAVISCDGFVPNLGTTEQSLELSILKKQLISKTGKIILAVDHSKIGAPGNCLCCPIDKIDTVVTDEGTPAEVIESLKKSNINVVVAGSIK